MVTDREKLSYLINRLKVNYNQEHLIVDPITDGFIISDDGYELGQIKIIENRVQFFPPHINPVLELNITERDLYLWINAQKDKIKMQR